MSCNPELQYKMAIVSMVTDDQSHPQHSLEKYLPLAKFQIKTVFTKKRRFCRLSGRIARVIL